MWSARKRLLLKPQMKGPSERRYTWPKAPERKKKRIVTKVFFNKLQLTTIIRNRVATGREMVREK